MVNLTGGRERPANYIAICNNIADSYPQGTPHGVQKDAIQNAVDAKKGKGPVKVQFEVVKNSKGSFFTITDAGTIGLTGPVLTSIEDYEEQLPEDFNWARFESFAFTKHSEDALGARGQGKFIFLHASSQYTMYYDTLRDDGIYRLGATKATETSCPIYPGADQPLWENNLGKRVLKNDTGLLPLQEIGTRIIIVNPNDHLVNSIEDGTFLQAIQETWFRLIQKKLLKIAIRDSKHDIQVSLPEPFPLPTKDVGSTKVWILGKDFDDAELKVQGYVSPRIKGFHVACLQKRVPDDLQGVAIIHNGMKIESLPMNIAPPQVRERICGFIEFDREIDRELRKGINQHPNHYGLKWRRQLPQAIKEYINRQLDTFGRKKLGLGIDPREAKRRRRTSADDWAMRQLLNSAKDLDLFGATGVRNPNPPDEPAPHKDIGVSINGFTYPDPNIAPRINWGQSLMGFGATAFSSLDNGRDVALSLVVLTGDSELINLVDKERFQLSPQRTKRRFGPFNLDITQSHFKNPGKHRLKCTLYDAETGEQIDSVSRRFWVEADPPLRQPFDIERVPGFDEPNTRRQFMITGSINNSPTLLCNTAHPAYRLAEEDEEELKFYMLELVLAGAVGFVLRRPNNDDGTPDFHPLQRERILGEGKPIEADTIPDASYDEIMRYVSDVRWKIFENQ